MKTRRDFLSTSSIAISGAALASGLYSGALAAAPAMNRRIVLASHPVGMPTTANFRLEQFAVPALKPGEILLHTQYLSLDPYMRSRMNAADGYAASVSLGQVMVGGTVARVEQSRNPKFQAGDMVMAYSGWQEYEVSNGRGVSKLDPRINPPSYALGVLGMPQTGGDPGIGRLHRSSGLGGGADWQNQGLSCGRHRRGAGEVPLRGGNPGLRRLHQPLRFRYGGATGRSLPRRHRCVF
jgi:hypothetical protein